MEKRKQVQNWRLRQARERRGWTQKDVADQIDLLDVRTLRRWEAGEASPSLRYRARLCELFALNAEELGLIPNVDPLLPVKEDQHPPESPQRSTEERYLSSTFLKSQLVSSREKWNRQQLLKKVYSFWIKGLPGQSLREATHLKPELCACPAVVTTPWTQAVQQRDWSSRPLPPDTHITQIYDEACGELLILGEPGTGKTSLLVELARDLLDRASENEAHPIPVIFNLSSWPLKQQPLTAWFIEELNSKYQVPQQVGLVWVEDDHILPLLDGLDEVGSAFRKACVDAINAYRQQHGLVPLVLCSRREEYLDLGMQILLQQAIYIQPLAQQHIEDYLTNSGALCEKILSPSLSSRKDPQVQPTKAVSWSWTRARKNVSSSLITAMFLAGTIGIIGGLFTRFLTGLSFGIIVTALFGLLSFLIIGFLSCFLS